MFRTLADIGLDPNIKIDSTGKCVAITIEDKHFEVAGLLYSLNSVVGCGTWIWVVTYGGVYYILKDSWIQHEHVDSEISMAGEDADENASGLLIDFDYSEELELVEHRENSTECEVNTDKAVDADEVTGPSEIFEAENICTGTLPFMAIKALLAEGNDKYAHLPRHDLESILYVILYICTFTKGPSLP
ncbi:hypothetical protein BYT27DRAFT_7263094 [Phlegmacium glaucopus]|nr:hypothetical protein BYT27DRAFT_7263094 [Phlegmacium glaucopus]